MLLAEKIGKFNQQVNDHLEKQRLNPFSGRFSRSPSPRPRGQDYGKPVAGSLTDIRGQKAKSHICREILELCTCIHDVAIYNKEQRKKDPDYEPDPDLDDDDSLIVTFGELFQIYTKINDKVVGLLIAAKKRGFVYFEKEILFQRRDDDVLIALVKPIREIQNTLRESLTPSPLPQAESSSRSVSPAPESSPKSKSPEKEVEQAIKEVKPPEKEKTPEPVKSAVETEPVKSIVEVTVTEPQTPEPVKTEEIGDILKPAQPVEIEEIAEVPKTTEENVLRPTESENQTETVPLQESPATAVESFAFGDGPGADQELSAPAEPTNEPLLRPAECGDVVIPLEEEKKEESSILLSEELSKFNLLDADDSSQIIELVETQEVAQAAPMTEDPTVKDQVTIDPPSEEPAA